MKYLSTTILSLFATAAMACPVGYHSETKTKYDWVCTPKSEYVCSSQPVYDPNTGETTLQQVCEWKMDNDCHYETSTYEECVPDYQPSEPWQPSEPSQPSTPAHPPATLDTLKEGDSVVTLRSTVLKVGPKVLATLKRGKELKALKLHEKGWFWTSITLNEKEVKGWVWIRDVYIKK